MRIEITDRHEEERLADPFRVVARDGGSHVLAVTRWTTVTAAASRRLNQWGKLGMAPFIEAALIRPGVRSGIVFDPYSFNGARTLAMVSAGVRVTAGSWHTRMGRYGVASTTSHSHP